LQAFRVGLDGQLHYNNCAQALTRLRGTQPNVTRQLTRERKPTLNPESFQRILAAAYVLQENNDRLAAKESSSADDSPSDYTTTLSEIVATQKLIQTRRLDLAAAIALIAERLQKITSASGVAVGIVETDELVYLACTGSAAGDAGSRLALDSCLTAYCLRSGRVLRCSNAMQDSRLRAELCRTSLVASLIAVPVFQEETVAGVVELRFAAANSFQDGDVRTSELMAGLVAEAIARASDQDLKRTLAAERATILQTLETIKPQLQRLAGESAASARAAKKNIQKAMPVEKTTLPVENQKPNGRTICRACAHPFEAGELYCGNCGVARLDAAQAGNIQSKVASLWYMQQAAERSRTESLPPQPDANKRTVSSSTASVKPVSLEEIVAQFSAPEELVAQDEPDSTNLTSSGFESRDGSQLQEDFPATEEESAEDSETGSQASEFEEHDWSPPLEPGSALQLAPVSLRIVPAESEVSRLSPWTSAQKSRQWLESLKARQGPKFTWLAQQWQEGRANIYTGIAALLLVVVVTLWVVQPGASGNSEVASIATASGRQARKSPPRPQLTLFEELLVGLGLAEPPPAPVYLGNPDTQVWVDLHTALYYCAGSQLYGKTPGGKMTTQRDAQQDQFEPANRRVCD
jgi:putative methionine-R-sulfoxide reductase with GAF domain